VTEQAITRILQDVAAGRDQAVDQLVAMVYDELKGLARAKVAHEKPGVTMQASDLVHEAFLRLVGGDAPQFEHRGHFFAAAAEAMRRILIDHYRAKKSLKRGGERARVPLDLVEVPAEVRTLNLETLGLALDRFSTVDPRAHQVVHLRYFLGLTVDDAAEILEVSPRTVKNDWRAARLWLKRTMEELGE
jgi:RNA polymerase sigma factor (TIGR02999 family)